jgi:hypothetical protein
VFGKFNAATLWLSKHWKNRPPRFPMFGKAGFVFFQELEKSDRTGSGD